MVVEGGQFFGTSKIPSGVPAPFPTVPRASARLRVSTFNVSTREYNFLFGAQFARRKYERWTPFGELLYGHQGTRGVASRCQRALPVTEIGTGRALVAGGGLDRKINRAFRIAVQGRLLPDRHLSFQLPRKQKQDNFRFSVGIVIRNVHKKKRTLEDETQLEP